MNGLLRCFMLVLLVLMSSCTDRFRVEEVLLDRDEVSLTWKGVEQLAYDPLTWQIGFNDERCEYRLNDDNMANFFVLRCDEHPVEVGQDVTASIEWTLATNIKKYDGLRFAVKKVDDSGKVWLWSRIQKIGVVVQRLEEP